MTLPILLNYFYFQFFFIIFTKQIWKPLSSRMYLDHRYISWGLWARNGITQRARI